MLQLIEIFDTDANKIFCLVDSLFDKIANKTVLWNMIGHAV